MHTWRTGVWENEIMCLNLSLFSVLLSKKRLFCFFTSPPSHWFRRKPSRELTTIRSRERWGCILQNSPPVLRDTLVSGVGAGLVSALFTLTCISHSISVHFVPTRPGTLEWPEETHTNSGKTYKLFAIFEVIKCIIINNITIILSLSVGVPFSKVKAVFEAVSLFLNISAL